MICKIHIGTGLECLKQCFPNKKVTHHLGDIHLIRPVNVGTVQTVAGFVSLHGDRHIVVAVKHYGQRHHKVHCNHCHGVRDEGAVKEEQS